MSTKINVPFTIGPHGEIPPTFMGLLSKNPMTIDQFHRNLAVVMLYGYPISELSMRSPSYDYRRLWVVLQAFCMNTLPGHYRQAHRMTIEKYCRVNAKTQEIAYQPGWAALEFLQEFKEDFVNHS